MIGNALQLLVIVTMVSIGLEIDRQDLIDGLRRPRRVATAAILNLVVFPAAVWLVVSRSDLTPAMATGLVVLAAAPGGPIGPMLSRLSHAHLGFATGLMVALGVVGLISTPLTIRFLVDVEAQTDRGIVAPMVVALLVSQILPLGIAVGIGDRFPTVAARLAKPLGLAANVLLVAVVAALIVVRGDLLRDTSWGVHLGLATALCVVLLPVLFTTGRDSLARSLFTVTAVRNMSVALFLASRFFTDPQVEAAILIWSFWMIVTTAVVGAVAGRFRTLGSPIAQPIVPVT